MTTTTEPKGDWWCQSCQDYLSWQRVTNDEKCATCGTPVEWRTANPTEPDLDLDLEKLWEKSTYPRPYITGPILGRLLRRLEVAENEANDLRSDDVVSASRATDGLRRMRIDSRAAAFEECIKAAVKLMEDLDEFSHAAGIETVLRELKD